MEKYPGVGFEIIRSIGKESKFIGQVNEGR